MKLCDRNKFISLILTVAAVFASSVFPVTAADLQLRESGEIVEEKFLSGAPAADEVPDVTAKSGKVKSAAKAPVQDGYYRVVNVASGKCLDVFSAFYDPLLRAHLDEKRAADSQIFALIRHANGSYSLCPKTDDTSTFLSVSEEAKEGAQLSRAALSTEYSKFRLEKNADGSYSVSPAAAQLSGYALAESETERYNGLYSFCELQKRDAYSDTQKWTLEAEEPLVPTLRISETEAAVKLYAISTLSATAYPAAYNENIKWTSSDHKVAVVDETGSFSTLALGTTVLTATCGSQSLSCTVTVGEKVATTWYSQCNLYSGGWNALPVSRLIFVSGVAKPFFLDNWNGRIDWMDEGCYLACAAMVLHNLDARKPEGYDLRTGQTGNLPADPYTVALANTLNYGPASASEILWGDPVLVGIHNIAAAFRVNGEPLTAQTQGYYSPAQIRDLLKDHPEGVIVGMINGRGRHYIVVTECVNPDAAPEDYRFLVCDPGAYYPSQGSNVPFEQSYSYQSMYYRDWNFFEVTVLNAAQ